MKNFTPFTSLGDISGKEAPIRSVIYLSYDGDKYAKSKLPNEEIVEVKIGYLFETECDLIKDMVHWNNLISEMKIK